MKVDDVEYYREKERERHYLCLHYIAMQGASGLRKPRTKAQKTMYVSGKHKLQRSCRLPNLKKPPKNISNPTFTQLHSLVLLVWVTIWVTHFTQRTVFNSSYMNSWYAYQRTCYSLFGEKLQQHVIPNCDPTLP